MLNKLWMTLRPFISFFFLLTMCGSIIGKRITTYELNEAVQKDKPALVRKYLLGMIFNCNVPSATEFIIFGNEFIEDGEIRETYYFFDYPIDWIISKTKCKYSPKSNACDLLKMPKDIRRKLLKLKSLPGFAPIEYGEGYNSYQDILKEDPLSFSDEEGACVPWLPADAKMLRKFLKTGKFYEKDFKRFMKKYDKKYPGPDDDM